MNIFGVRFSLIGDMIMALPIKDYLAEKYPDSKLTWSVAKKCSQAAFLFRAQPGIEKVKVSDFDEALGDEDQKIIAASDLVFNVMPPHPAEPDWYNYRSCVEETALQASLDPKLFCGARPKLRRWWNIPLRFKKAIAIYPFAGYGRGLERSPSREWWESLCLKLIGMGYEIHHFGTPNEPDLVPKGTFYSRYTNFPFFEQIKLAMMCSLVIGTDSGSMWCIGAYQEIPQINLLTDWLPNHNNNPFALAPVSPMAWNFFRNGGCSNINQNEVAEQVERMIK